MIGWRTVSLGVAAAVAVAVGAFTSGGGGGAACSGTNVTTSTFASAYAAASGSTLCLAAGSYGTFTGTSKAATVTIGRQSGVAKSAVTMYLAFGGSSNRITVDGLTVTGMDMDTAGTTKNITVKNSTFTGQTIIKSCSSSNTNILLDTNTYDDIDTSGTYEGRIEFAVDGGGTCGVTIQNSHFARGCSDGIQTGANGIQILNNEFDSITQSCDPSIAHVDSIQLYGSSNTLIQGNYFHGAEDCIMAPDGADHEIAKNNVCQTASTQYGFTFGSDNTSQIIHNTFRGSSAVRVYGGNSGTASAGTILRDNVMPGGGTFTATGGTNDYNLGFAGGAHSVAGSPTYTGGTTPTTYAGYHLTSGSLGHLAASDGTDIGIP